MRSSETPLADPPGAGVDPRPTGDHPRGGRINFVLRRLVVAVVGLNLFVLAMLVSVTAVGGDEEAADTATESNDPADTAGTGEVDGGNSATGDPGEPVDGVAAIPTEPPPVPEPFEPTANEVQPDAKRLGAFVAHVMTNYEADWSLADVITTLPTASSQDVGLVAAVALVHHPGMWSRGTVEYVQLGGHLDGRISNFVVLRQDIGVDGSSEPSRTETRVIEVHLARNEAGEWTLETIDSAGGLPAERPADLSAVAAAVVDHERIDLPDTAVWDIYRGFIDRPLLEVMLELADRTPYSVVVLQTGHSHNVFGTNRVSNHAVGRAVDIYQLDTELVVDAHATSSNVYAVSEWIVSRDDIREFGSPWRFADAVAHNFTNEVHHDHLHIGVNP